MKLKELIEAIGIDVDAGCDVEVTGVECDSRKIVAGGVFVAISGEHFDGADFIEAAASSGAACVVTERKVEAAQCKQVVVEDAGRAYAILSSVFFGKPSEQMRMAAVTGTNGKTTVAYLLESIFEAAGFKSALMGTVQNRYAGVVQDSTLTTPMAGELQGFLRTAANAGVTHCVMEVSSHALSQHRVDGCSFDVKVFTNLTPEHLDYHGTMENYFEEKSRLFASECFEAASSGSVINVDDKWGSILKGKTMPSLGYSLKVEAGADIYPKCYALTSNGIKATLRIPGSVLTINSELVGEYNLYNIMAAVGAAYVMGIEGSMIEKGISALKLIPGRLERVRGELGFDVYVDYAHTSDALTRTLKVLASLKKGGRLITVFGCGGNRDITKRSVMGAAAVELSEVAIVTSDNPRDEDPMDIIAEIEEGIGGVNKFDKDADVIGKGYLIIPERGEAIRKAIEIARSGDIVLVAGKGHEDYQIIKGERIFFDDRVVLRESLQSVLDEGSRSA
jgi:UDP-N-acetylmuramoyl-L-alanyl-D-glutamate--2,6-diaminopimelate ligase